MSFWNLDDGESAKDVGTNYDAGGGNFDPIPDGTSVLAMIDEAKWDTNKENDEYCSLRWTVVKPEAFGNRKIFQKLWLTDPKPGTKDAAKDRDKAKRMLAAIDANAGGKLMKLDKRPTNEDLAVCLTNKMMVIRLGVWDIDGKSGNWVQAVSPKSAEISDVKAKPKPKPKAPVDDIDNDDVPF